MNQLREPLPRWRYPTEDILRNRVFPSGKPPFAPFPTVSSLLNVGVSLPSMYDEWLNGIDGPMLGRYYRDHGIIFHECIASLKLALKHRAFSLPVANHHTQLEAVRIWFQEEFSPRNDIKLAVAQRVWGQYLQPWVSRKLENQELPNITAEQQIFFELSVTNARIAFPIGNGVRHYPLRGRIDEIDLGRGVIIERTIEEESSLFAPFLKDYQLWLLQQILISIPPDKKPDGWAKVDFSKFRLIVETPQRDYEIRHDNNYIAYSHDAYAWIHDATIDESPQITRQIFDPATRTSFHSHPAAASRKQESGRHTYRYPQSRPSMRQIFQPWKRLLLWEQIWKGHLRHYQLSLLDQDELSNLGLMIPTKGYMTNENEQLCIE